MPTNRPPLPRAAALGLPILLFLLGLAPAGAGPVPDLPSLDGLSEVEVLELPALDHGELRARDQSEAGPGVPPRFAEPIDVKVSFDSHGTWQRTAEDVRWRLRVRSPGAVNLALGFVRYHLPRGAELRIYSPDGKRSIRPFDARDNEEHGQLWTPILEGDELVIDLRMPARALPGLRLELGRVLHGYRTFGQILKSGSCNVDVVCPEGDGWRDEIRSVAVIGTGGGTFCTGFLVNNTAQDLKPYFMTAFHCGIGVGTAPSLVVYWNYENSTCRTPGSPDSGGPGDGTLDQFQTGSVLRAEGSASDFTLVELDDAPDSAWNVHWAGWDRSTGDFAAAIAIHHPDTDEKRISFENQPTTTTSYLQDAVPGDGSHVRVEDWDVGTTEPGSSGSPLFSPEGRVIGQLHGGFAACGNDDPDWYGRFDVSWEGGGTAATRLSDWLDPTASGATTLDGRDAAPDFGLVVAPSSRAICAGADAAFTVDVTATLGFSDPVTLSVVGEPAGTTAGFSTNPVSPPGTSTLTISQTGGATTGTYPLTLTGNGGGNMHIAAAELSVFSALPTGTTPTAPGDGATDQPVDVEFTWPASADAATYTIQVSNDPGFTDLADSASGVTGTSWQSAALAGSSEYYWRLRPENGCGNGPWSAIRSFTTEALPGDCPLGSTAEVLWSDDLESGAAGWASSGTGDTWGPSSDPVHSGSNAYHADEPASVTDQYLDSPAVALPADLTDLTLTFYHLRDIEDSSSGGCFDGAVLEISTDGSAWTRLESELLTDPYDGTVSNEYESPIADSMAWCGSPEGFLRSVVDIDAWAGQSVQFRFRMTSDSSVGAGGWNIDDASVKGCRMATDIFADDFESGGMTSWSERSPE